MKGGVMSRFETRRDAKLRKLGTLGPMVAASLCRRMVTCGNPRCKCAGGEKHESWCLTYKVRAKTKTVHVPRDMVKEVEAWVKEHRRAKELLSEISELGLEIIRRHVPARRAAECGRSSGRKSRR
jgi:hypothetical protein